ncbi:hypothetical protein BKA70DRAFT_1565532 [Coprinopsis sp. MPI-PUGE-AT-0042]|nr:hypothetical protein BKA70DRAFT_1565532 [Coprinopsis sp. MPI-PUGE-AT-0042]
MTGWLVQQEERDMRSINWKGRRAIGRKAIQFLASTKHLSLLPTPVWGVQKAFSLTTSRVLNPRLFDSHSRLSKGSQGYRCPSGPASCLGTATQWSTDPSLFFKQQDTLDTNVPTNIIKFIPTLGRLLDVECHHTLADFLAHTLDLSSHDGMNVNANIDEPSPCVSILAA